MRKFDQRGQEVETQYNAAGNINITVTKEKPCYICGKLCAPGEIYRCKRCHQIVCINHARDTNLSFCPDCSVLVELETRLESPNDDERLSAAQGLYTKNDKSTLETVRYHFKSELYAPAKYWLALALGQIGGETAREDLEMAKTLETNSFVIQGIEEALLLIRASPPT